MSGIHKSKIEWCDSTWNPVSGCLHGCEYCYAARQVKRFKPQPGEWPEPGAVHSAAHDPRCFIEVKPTVLRDGDGKYLRSTPYPKGFAPTIHNYKLDFLKTAKAPRKIFVGSMTDLFGEWVPDEWLAAVFRACHEAPQHVYIFLTKNPERYTELARSGLLPEEDNYWYGTTATTDETPYWFSDRHNTFVSIEPILGSFEKLGDTLFPPRWFIVGAMTGPGKKENQPQRAWIENIASECERIGAAMFMKNSLADVWREPLIQQFPASMEAHIERGGRT